MDYIVRVWTWEDYPQGNRRTSYYEFFEKDDAIAYAEKEAKELKATDYEYDIEIYELTNY